MKFQESDSCTHRLMCEYCLEPIAHYSFSRTERKFMDNLKTICCPECDMKYENWMEQKLTQQSYPNVEDEKK